jgi:hypothetical protein
MRTFIVLGCLASLVTLTGCDFLKKGSAQSDGAAPAGSTTTSNGGNGSNGNAAPTDTAVAVATDTTNDPTKGATSACAWPADGGIEKNFTITKGCTVVAKHSLDVKEGATLTIEEGVKISFDTDAYLWVRYGKLVIAGTAAAPVTFTSANTSPAPGDWVGIGFEEKTASGTSIDHLVIEYTGSKASSGKGAIELEDMRTGGRISITNTTVKNGAQFGVVAGDNATFAKFENNTFKDLKSGSLNVKAEVLGSVGHGNTFAPLPIHVKNSVVDQNTTWPTLDVPVFVDGDIDVKSDSSVPVLTIADKTIVKMATNAMIDTGDGQPGALVAKNVLFTSGSPAPSEGDWAGIFIHPKSSGTIIDSCSFEFFGNGSHSSHGAITLEDVEAKDLHGITITNNTFRKGKWQGIFTNDGDCATMRSNKGDGIPACGKDR